MDGVCGTNIALNVQVFGDTDAVHAIGSVATDTPTFTLDELLPDSGPLPDGVVHVRIRCGNGGLPKAFADAPSALPSVIVPLLLSDEQNWTVAPLFNGHTLRDNLSENTRSCVLRGRLIHHAAPHLEAARNPRGIVFTDTDGTVRAVSGR